MTVTAQMFSPAEFSKRTGLPISTLHYYEQIGLLGPVTRAANGHRRYSAADLRRVDFLKRVRATGMSIREMQAYVRLFHEGDSTAARRCQMLETHREAVLMQMHELQETLALLERKIAAYRLQLGEAE